MKQYKGVVLSGGGNKGFLMLGALQCEAERKRYDRNFVEYYAGTSVGSIIVFLLASGYEPSEILVKSLGIENFFSVSDFNDIWSIYKNMGIATTKTLVSQLEELIIDKIGLVPTFQELFEITGKRLTVCASNLTKMRREYFSLENNPDMCCLEAVRISCSIPILFEPIAHSEGLMVDGGLADNLPLKAIDDGTRSILAIATCMSDILTDNRHVDYLMRLITLPVNLALKKTCEEAGKNVYTIFIEWVGDRPVSGIGLDRSILSLDRAGKVDMFDYGYEVAKLKASERIIRVKWF